MIIFGFNRKEFFQLLGEVNLVNFFEVRNISNFSRKNSTPSITDFFNNVKCVQIVQFFWCCFQLPNISIVISERPENYEGYNLLLLEVIYQCNNTGLVLIVFNEQSKN